METSFVGEHSVELILGPAFAEILRHKFGKVTPMYFWSSREGGLISRDCYRFNKVRIVALYPRRPKVAHPYSSEILVKFNENLFTRCAMFKENGISVFAGVPLAGSLDDFYYGIKCTWFRIEPQGSEQFVQISLKESADICLPGIQEVSERDILEQIERDSVYFEWPNAQKLLRRLNDRSGTVWERSIWGDRYKPIYFVIPFN